MPRAWRAWREASGITTGALFRGVNRHGKLTPHRLDGRDVARILQRAAGAAELQIEELGGHFLRAGFITAAALAGKSERDIMNHTGHRSRVQVRRYIRHGRLFTDNAAQNIGL
ncbi:hypothetical protein WMF27_28010 [Sorangium sp. So ce281]|uniref:hypothetical protein n=1 Tax=unclassified Sorangium TaxID=2621164 RepID=UPI003F613404